MRKLLTFFVQQFRIVSKKNNSKENFAETSEKCWLENDWNAEYPVRDVGSSRRSELWSLRVTRFESSLNRVDALRRLLESLFDVVK